MVKRCTTIACPQITRDRGEKSIYSTKQILVTLFSLIKKSNNPKLIYQNP